MLELLLTIMLFILPFLILQRDVPRSGLFTGLWISLFFWGQIHALCSILTFGVGLIYYMIQPKGIGREVPDTWDSPEIWVPRPGARPLTGGLAMIMIFCAFGNVCTDYGMYFWLMSSFRETATLLGFLGSLTGPIFFGALNDRKGPFFAFLFLLVTAAGSVITTALSHDFPYCFLLGSLLMDASIAGSFTLIPLLLLRFYGRPQLSFVLPFLFLFLSGLWSASNQFYLKAGARPQDYLMAMAFLIVMTFPFIIRAWRHRLGVL